MLKMTKKTLLTVVALGSFATASRATVNLSEATLTLGAAAGTYYLLAHHEPALHTNNPIRRTFDNASIYANRIINYLDQNKGKIAAAALVAHLINNRNNINLNDFPATAENLALTVPFLGPLLVSKIQVNKGGNLPL